MKISEIDDRVAYFLAESRMNAEITQIDMAKRMGISRRTLQAWEAGDSVPKLSLIIKWMTIVRQNPINVLQEICAPAFQGIKPNDNDERISEALRLRVESLRPHEKRSVFYILHGKHGSSVYAFLQLCVAYLQCPMGDRQSIALMVINNYKNAKEMGRLSAPDNVQPDMEALEHAYEQGRQAYINNSESYINI